MKNVKNDLRKVLMYLGVLVVTMGVVSCSDDDDGTEVFEPTGFFEIEDNYDLTGNTLMLERITVGQDSWLVAVNPGDENTDNFISDPVMLDEGVNTDVMLNLDEDAITDDGTGQQIVLKLYADRGTLGVWDPADEPIMDENNLVMTEAITIFAETGTATFADFDTNNDGVLDENEVPLIYQDNFEVWDTDDDDMLSRDEFDTTIFGFTDMNADEGIDQNEWNEGFANFFGNWTTDDFATFDTDDDDILSYDEWQETFADSPWYETYDADNDAFVTQAELNRGFFTDWDANEDNFVDEDEFDAVSPFVIR